MNDGRRYTGKEITCKTRGCKNTFPERLGVKKEYCNSCNSRRGVMQQHKSRGEKVPTINAGSRKPWQSMGQHEINMLYNPNRREDEGVMSEFVHSENPHRFAKYVEGVR